MTRLLTVCRRPDGTSRSVAAPTPGGDPRFGRRYLGGRHTAWAATCEVLHPELADTHPAVRASRHAGHIADRIGRGD